MANKSPVEKELLAATLQKERGKKEEASEYLVRIAQAVEGLSDPKYQKLSEEAQNWFTQAAAMLSKDPPNPEGITAFDAVAEEAAEDETETTEETAEEETTEEAEEEKAEKKTSKKEPSKKEKLVPKKEDKKKEEKKPVEAESKPDAAKKGPPKRENSIASAIRYAMCEDPDLTKEGVAKILKEKRLSFDQSRLDQIFSFTAAVLAILKELKKLK